MYVRSRTSSSIKLYKNFHYIHTYIHTCHSSCYTTVEVGGRGQLQREEQKTDDDRGRPLPFGTLDDGVQQQQELLETCRKQEVRGGSN